MAPNAQHFGSQDVYLYDVQWSKEVDNIFVDVLCYEAEHGNLVYGRQNLAATVMAVDAIWSRCKVMCTQDQCSAQLSKLFKRYTTVSWMISLPNVMYDPITNVFRAPEHAWQFIVQSNPFALAYRYNGDPKWVELCDTFSPRTAEEIAVNNNVIVLSSEDSGDEDNDTPLPNAHVPVPMNPTVQQQNLSRGSSQPRSASSRNFQRSIWEYIGYVSDSEPSRETFASTANSKPKNRRKAFMKLMPSRRPPIPPPPMAMPNQRPSNSTCSSSCASNDTFGRRSN